MSGTVRISIIMGVYNPARRRFFEAVESIVRQRFADWELLLYDDGSAQAYRPLLRRAARKDERIRLLEGGENRGLAHALNRCLEEAAGTYIARMDDDDIARPDRLEKQAAFLDAYPRFQWVGSNAELLDGKGVWGFRKMPEIPQTRDFLFTSPYIHPSVMFRREVLLAAGGYDESPRLRLCEDYELFMRLHRLGGRGYNLQEPLLQYWEDYASHRKRTYRRRIREMQVRWRGFRDLGILDAAALPYVCKPLAAAAIPAPVHHYIRRRQNRPGAR